MQNRAVFTNAVQLDARGVSSWDYFHALVYAKRAAFTNALQLDSAVSIIS